MKVFIWVFHRPSPEYGKPATGARVTICAEDEPEARRLLETLMPKELSVNAILLRKTMREAQPTVYEAKGYAELILNDGRKTTGLIQTQQAGPT